jgi:hypothetical protein
VADGAGSAALGKVGATLAACAAVTFIGAESRPPDWPDSAADWRQWLVDALHTAQATVQAEARARQVPVRVLATTLILVVALPTCVAVAQIGDGAVVVGDMGGQLLPLTVPQSGEYPNETTFLTSPHALDTAQVCVWSGLPRHIAAFSDGLQRLALHMPDGHPHVPFFLPFLRVMETVTEVGTVQTQVEAFLRSQRIRERTDDDITLVLGTFRRAGDDAGAVSL